MVYRVYNSCRPCIRQVSSSKYSMQNALSCDVGERLCNGMPEFIRACYLRWAKFPKQDNGLIRTLANQELTWLANRAVSKNLCFSKFHFSYCSCVPFQIWPLLGRPSRAVAALKAIIYLAQVS